MEYFYEIENTRDSSTNTVLLVGIKSINFDNDGNSRVIGKRFSRLTLRYLNGNIEHITFKDDDFGYASKIYNEIKAKSDEIITGLLRNGDLGSIFK
ncbi:hypothetical protein CLV86_0967 [Lacinutrix venerupis]|nr:hypothetical protein CLV86_0967 [Lacinutrix venerupis]